MHGSTVTGLARSAKGLCTAAVCMEGLCRTFMPLLVYKASPHFWPANSRAYAASRSPSVAEPLPLPRGSGLVKIRLLRRT